MRDEFVKFPRTPHLFWLGKIPPRHDKLLSADQAMELLRRPTAIEEKVDGACVGISVSERGELRAQNRGGYIARDTQQQFGPLWRWLAVHENLLCEVLGPHLILFGEWCYARHSVAYDRLPDWFLSFDVYDRRTGRFWSRKRRDQLARSAGIATVPLLAVGTFDRAALERHMTQSSRFGVERMEGVYLRWDQRLWLDIRAKLVRASWVDVRELHWSKRPLVLNRCADTEPGLTRSP